MKHSGQMSESIRLGVVLALAGGYMDAYSYMCRGNVFANAQTGNILLMGVHLSGGEFALAVRYFFPIFAFAAGIALADIAKIKWKNSGRLHWRQNAVFIEMLVLAGVGFFPQTMNLAANSLTSFACGIQVESFRSIRGNGIATTMCIGNLRSGTESIIRYLETHAAEYLYKGALYYGIIICFVLGAVMGNIGVELAGEKAIFFCALLLLLAFLMMFRQHETK